MIKHTMLVIIVTLINVNAIVLKCSFVMNKMFLYRSSLYLLIVWFSLGKASDCGEAMFSLWTSSAG